MLLYRWLIYLLVCIGIHLKNGLRERKLTSDLGMVVHVSNLSHLVGWGRKIFSVRPASLRNLERSFYKTKQQTEKLIKVALFFLLWLHNKMVTWSKCSPSEPSKVLHRMSGNGVNWYTWTHVQLVNNAPWSLGICFFGNVFIQKTEMERHISIPILPYASKAEALCVLSKLDFFTFLFPFIINSFLVLYIISWLEFPFPLLQPVPLHIPYNPNPLPFCLSLE